MYLLDTDHLSLLERGGVESERLRRRIQTVPPDELAVTVVSYEEQTRGWLSYMAKARSVEEQVTAYSYLQSHLQVFCAIPLIAFDPAAAAIVQQLLRRRIRIGIMDLKIAGITLARNATLLSRNVTDFRKVPGLHVEDWTSRVYQTHGSSVPGRASRIARGRLLGLKCIPGQVEPIGSSMSDIEIRDAPLQAPAGGPPTTGSGAGDVWLARRRTGNRPVVLLLGLDVATFAPHNVVPAGEKRE